MRETAEFSARGEEFDALDTRIVGISIDNVALQKEHAIKCATNYPLLSDSDKRLIRELGIEREDGKARRTTYILDRNGNVARVYEGVKIDGHVDEVLAGVKELGRT